MKNLTTQNMADMVYQKYYGNYYKELIGTAIFLELKEVIQSFCINVKKKGEGDSTRYRILVEPKSDHDMRGASCITYFDLKDEVYKIETNQEESFERFNYGLSHGFGHLLFGHVKPDGDKIIDFKYNNYDEQEEVVNDFCGRLLVPYHSLYEYSRTSSSVNKIAKMYGVTPLLVTKRLKQTGIIK